MTQLLRDDPQSVLAIYLNDHLAGATAGLELFRRATEAHRGTPTGAVLERLTREVAEDRQTLLSIMRSLLAPVRTYKVVLAIAAERVGRLKPNGRLRGRSSLSSLIELESLKLGVEGKASLWSALLAVADRHEGLDRERLTELSARARRQADELEQLRVETATQVFAPK
jgi:hypothetical protein